MQPIALLLLLLLLVTPAIAHATNEGSYKFGFSVGFSGYNHCFDNGADALDCSPPDNDASLQVCVNNPVNHNGIIKWAVYSSSNGNDKFFNDRLEQFHSIDSIANIRF